MASPSTRRPYNGALIAVFLALSGAGLWFMRINIILNDVPAGFNAALEAGVLPNGTRIKKDYTGIAAMDEVLALLVSAFLYGTAGWNEPFYWQQLHFLLQITGLIAIMNVEACRERNRNSWLKYTAVFSFLYQNIGGAVIIPLWMLLLHKASAEKSYFASGRIIPMPYMGVLLPSTVFIYALPAIVLFIPGSDLITLQNLLAFWQWTPVFVNIPLWFASTFVSSEPERPSKHANEDDRLHLKLLYGVMFGISVAAHWVTIIGIATSANPTVSFSSVFVPNPATWKTTMDYGLLWIFQWDWIICGIVHVLPAWIAVYDVQRLLHGAATSEQLIKGAGAIAALTLVGGPGAALAAVWGWREEKLALVEEQLSSGKKKL